MEEQAVNYAKGQLYSINLSDLHPDPNQPRKYIDPAALDELTASIKQHGVLEPILFRQDGANGLFVVAGERRFAAAQSAGLLTIPAIFVDGNHAEISIIENLLRQDLTAIEEAEALKGLMEGQQYTQEQLSSIIGKARSTIAEILTLNRLSENIRSECRNNPAISRATLLDIAKKKQERSMMTAYNKYKEKLIRQSTQQDQKHEKATPAQALTEWINKTIEKLEDLDVSNWTPEEKTDAKTVLVHLKTAVNAAAKALTEEAPTTPPAS